MNIARCRGSAVFVNLRSLNRAPRIISIRTISSSNTALKSKKKTESTDFEALPKTKRDPAGIPVKPLEPLPEYKKPHHAPSVDVAEDEERLYKDAIASGDIPDTALAKQVYLNWKRFPDCVVLTRVGKFYEVSIVVVYVLTVLMRQSYFAPAIRLSSLLNLKLANRKYSGGTWPFSGFPTTHLDKYLKILVQDLGQTVVLVEEIPLEDDAAPSELKPRKVGRVVTPGTLLDESWLNGSESRYLLALAIGTKSPDSGETSKLPISLAYTDASTGEFFSKYSDMGQIEDELARVAPREVVLDTSLRELWETGKGGQSGDLDDLLDLLRVVGVHVSFADPVHAPLLEGLSPLPSTSTAGSASLESRAITLLRHHLQYALRDSMPSLPNEPQRQLASSHMQIDAATLAALEIRHAIRPGGLVELPGYGRSSTLLSAKGTLLSVISQTVTAPGHRLLIRTLTSPSTDIDAINSRLSLVEAFVKRRDLRDDLRQSLKDVGDIMRVVQRFKSQRGSARDIWDTATWIRGVDRLLNRLQLDLGDVKAESKTSAEGRNRLQDLVNQFKYLTACAEKIEASVDESSLLRGLEMEGEEEDPDGVEAAGDALVASSNSKKDKETKRESQEREREEREQALWWIRPG
jgi:DNA mismatch repair ATPase MutS